MHGRCHQEPVSAGQLIGSVVVSVPNQAIHDAGISQRGGIVEGIDLIGGDFAQNAADDLPRAGLEGRCAG